MTTKIDVFVTEVESGDHSISGFENKAQIKWMNKHTS